MAITADKLDWLIDITPMMTPISHTNWDTLTVNTSQIKNGYPGSSGAQNDAIAFDVVLVAGTWDIEVLYSTSFTRGIASVRLDNVEQGTIDMYSSSTVYNVRGSVAGISVAITGKKRLSLVMATKNASSSNYYGFISHIQLRRTA